MACTDAQITNSTCSTGGPREAHTPEASLGVWKPALHTLLVHSHILSDPTLISSPTKQHL